MKTDQLQNSPLFQGLSKKELEGVKTCLREKSFAKGEALFLEGQMCERVFIVQEGQVKIYRLASSGREQVLETLGPGDTCACNPGTKEWSCSSSAEALTTCSVWFFSRRDYVKLIENNTALVRSLNQVFAKRLQCFGSLIEEVSLKDVKKRVIKFLLDVSDLSFTQEEIAERVGSARETVTRYLNQLKRAKLIDIKPKKIVVLNPKALRKLLL